VVEDIVEGCPKDVVLEASLEAVEVRMSSYLSKSNIKLHLNEIYVKTPYRWFRLSTNQDGTESFSNRIKIKHDSSAEARIPSR